MAQCLILKSFAGSQDGRHTTQFKEGDVADLSEYLMASADKSWFQRIDAAPAPANKAIITTTGRNKRNLPEVEE